MMKNVRLKKLLKGTVYKPVTIINKIFPKMNKHILLYIPSDEIRHNLKPLLEYLLEQGYNSKYKIVCGVKRPKYKESNHPNVKYVTELKAQFYFLFTKYVFYTAGQIPIKPSKRQSVLHLTHGTPFYKTIGLLTNINNGDEFYFNGILATCELFRPIMQKGFACPSSAVFICNEPMTDIFMRQDYKRYDFEGAKKTVFWLPTFRQSDELGYDNSSLKDTLLVFKEEEYKELNDYLEEKSVKLIVKLHTAQSLKNYEMSRLSNLSIYSNEDFTKAGFEIYTMLRQVDGLISDYSSVALQYLLMDRPLAYVIPDMEDYKRQRGFVFENPLDYMPGHIVKNKQNFYEFIDQISAGKDVYRTERRRLRDTLHQYQDGNACQRILEMCGIKK